MHTYSPLHGVDHKSTRAADPDAAEEHGSAFVLISVSGDTEGAWDHWSLLLVQKRLGVGRCDVVEAVYLEAGLDHI